MKIITFMLFFFLITLRLGKRIKSKTKAKSKDMKDNIKLDYHSIKNSVMPTDKGVFDESTKHVRNIEI